VKRCVNFKQRETSQPRTNSGKGVWIYVRNNSENILKLKEKVWDFQILELVSTGDPSLIYHFSAVKNLRASFKSKIFH